MAVKCSNCSEEVPDHLQSCTACGTDNGFPNVRLASSDKEVKQLAARVVDAYVSARAGKFEPILNDFGSAVKSSKTVLSRSIATLHNLVGSTENIYVSFATEVAAGVRRPRDNEFDRVRQQYESALFPYFHEKILFACLTLDGRGMSGYGAYYLLLKDVMVAQRSTVFEENPHTFVEKHNILLNKPIPPGYRATWDNRHSLAQAKLYPEINKDTKVVDFPAILAKDNKGTGNSDFIEVHIFGSINLKALESVTGTVPRLKEDRTIWKSIKRKLATQGIRVVEQ